MLRKDFIEQELNKALNPESLSVEDESRFHHVPENAQTHFKISVVSSQFNGLKRIERHKIINQLFKKEFDQGLHALSMHLYTSEEWKQQSNSVLKSPACKDGYKNAKGTI